MKKIRFKILIPIVLIFIGGFIYFLISRPGISEQEAALIVNNGEEKRAFSGKVIQNMTVLDALIASSRAGKFDFDYNRKGILESVDKFKQNKKKWMVYLNGKKVEKDLDKVLIKAGDRINLTFK